ncbi:MAG: class I SAM-dependent methyltransferase [Acidimicrobiales bacterium]
MRRLLGPVSGKRAADIGCGHDAALARALFQSAQSTLLVDVALDSRLTTSGVQCREGYLPQVLVGVADESLDAIICNNVIEHLDHAEETLGHLFRLTAPGGVCVINVPSWRGKRFLELAAFRLGMAPADEMNDHKTYYDPKDLWPLLVRAGFRPSEISVRRHKGGLNTIASCRKPRSAQ